jgi:lysozyme family protein
MTEEQIIDDILRREGSIYTNHSSDRGRSTKYGITLATLREERGPFVTAEDVAKLTENEAREIYARRYIRRPGFDMVADDRLRALLIDFGVNSGPKRAVIALQRAIGADPDGIFGTDTMRRLEADGLDLGAVCASVLKARLMLYVNIVLGDPSQVVFLRGWMNRLAEFF